MREGVSVLGGAKEVVLVREYAVSVILVRSVRDSDSVNGRVNSVVCVVPGLGFHGIGTSIVARFLLACLGPNGISDSVVNGIYSFVARFVAYLLSDYLGLKEIDASFVAFFIAYLLSNYTTIFIVVLRLDLLEVYEIIKGIIKIKELHLEAIKKSSYIPTSPPSYYSYVLMRMHYTCAFCT